MSRWKLIDPLICSSYPHLIEDEECGFAREYKPGQGFAGETNNLIINFKKGVQYKGSHSWKYRNSAVRTFAQELSELTKKFSGGVIPITSIPSSKLITDVNYDNRFEDMFSELVKLDPRVKHYVPIRIKQTVTASHSGGNRNPKLIKKNYDWTGFPSRIPFLIIVDDVLTTGSHFRAYNDFCRENGFSNQIFGAFWARSTY